MAMDCLPEDDIHNQWYGSQQPGLWNQLSIQQAKPGRVNEKTLKLKRSRGTGSGSYPQSDYATNFMAGASTGSTYTAGGGISVTSTNNTLSNSYSLSDAVNMK